jgi:hypothetical protein
MTSNNSDKHLPKPPPVMIKEKTLRLLQDNKIPQEQSIYYAGEKIVVKRNNCLHNGGLEQNWQSENTMYISCSLCDKVIYYKSRDKFYLMLYGKNAIIVTVEDDGRLAAFN